MKIGIDARLINETGVGRYIQNLLKELAVLDKKNQFVVFLTKNAFSAFQPPNNRWQKRLADIRWHSVAEQFVMPWLLVKEHLDLVHIPYFNVPIFYPGKFIVTIHDLTILHFDTGKASTLPLPLYKFRRLGYYIALAVGLKRASKIIAVSETTKKEITDHFQIDSEKVVVTYEGVNKMVTSDKRQVTGPYFLYVGNAYPHKNLETLLKAFQQTTNNKQQTTKLVLVGKDDFFYQRLRKTVSKSVIFFGEANDEELGSLYQHAIALVFPSLMEGFGLPGLEAMAIGTPVVCSDISVFHEVYEDAALYFDPKNKTDILSKLQTIIFDKKLREHFIRKGIHQVKQYSWNNMVRRTLFTYFSW